MPGRQDRVNGCQVSVNEGQLVYRKSLTGSVIENLVAAVIGIALLGYLVYALVRPERF